MTDGGIVVKKRLATDSSLMVHGSPVDRTLVVVDRQAQGTGGEEQFDQVEEMSSELHLTPQKSQNKKKLKNVEGIASASLVFNSNDARSAALLESDRRAQ